MAADVKGIIYGINGPVIYIKGKTAFRMGEMVYVGPQKLVGEVIRLDSCSNFCNTGTWYPS